MSTQYWSDVAAKPKDVVRDSAAFAEGVAVQSVGVWFLSVVGFRVLLSLREWG